MPELTESQYKRRRKEIDFGLANNAFGAAAGAVGTRAVYRQSREKHMPERHAKWAAKRAAKQAAKKPGRISRVSAHVGSKIPNRVKPYVGPALVGGAVGTQVLNAGADAQSAAFFARERAAMAAARRKRKKTESGVAKFDSGMASGVEFGKDFGTWRAQQKKERQKRWRKAKRSYKEASARRSARRDIRASAPEPRRKAIYQQGLATAGGAAVAGGGAALGAHRLANAEVPGMRSQLGGPETVRGAWRSVWDAPDGGTKMLRRVGRKAAVPAAIVGGGAYVASRAHRASRGETRHPWY